MPVLEWSESFATESGLMDDVHHEFVEILNRMAEAQGDDLVPAIDAFIAHTVEHFAQEERWMEETGFPPMHCHLNQHQSVLEVAREVRRLAPGDPRYGRLLAEAVAQWFNDHITTQDTWLAQFMVQQGYTPTREPAAKKAARKSAGGDAAKCGHC